jgi:predicted neutral ceramidase superfamily lipid hydrolase
MGNSFKAESLDSMDWRAEASEIAYNTFMHILSPSEKVFGIGHDGFMARGYGFMGVYAAHNGILLMLIEFGIAGFLIYHLMLISLITKTMNSKYFSPLAVCIIYIFLYVTSHNREMTSLTAFLIAGTLAAEAAYVPEEITQEVTEIATPSPTTPN